jgi:hypothetical protein
MADTHESLSVFAEIMGDDESVELYDPITGDTDRGHSPIRAVRMDEDDDDDHHDAANDDDNNVRDAHTVATTTPHQPTAPAPVSPAGCLCASSFVA